MLNWITILCLCVLACAQINDVEDYCVSINCIGEEYECVNGECLCAAGFVPNKYHNRCIRCPGLGDKCYNQCCNRFGNASIQCWQGVCQICFDDYGNWICRDKIDQIFLVSTTQIVMGVTLILGIIATFILLYKLCTVTNLRPLGDRNNSDGRLSIGSLQLYVEERLRDAPPRYSRAPVSGSAIYPGVAYLNSGFVHDSSLPPPPYTETKRDDNTPNTLHI